eukprot:CAMPEP_0206056384 /NCGR_PEP_ID=MMETSP1466-20131121/42064_1 /ASSEMBLY_ACC=CAM_ASM_001126 /TAXON_ID=44452 /ORGANISM="Pavlova gyrans, Strain CCMP608" /LENGTH=136 /DNA_ID=CAMNT_0053431619 /DNA_START=159 /DNA_END=569 /DNA_ORIENTATION=+
MNGARAQSARETSAPQRKGPLERRMAVSNRPSTSSKRFTELELGVPDVGKFHAPPSTPQPAPSRSRDMAISDSTELPSAGGMRDRTPGKFASTSLQISNDSACTRPSGSCSAGTRVVPVVCAYQDGLSDKSISIRS